MARSGLGAINTVEIFSRMASQQATEAAQEALSLKQDGSALDFDMK